MMLLASSLLAAFATAKQRRAGSLPAPDIANIMIGVIVHSISLPRKTYETAKALAANIDGIFGKLLIV
jgi:hypothetical protein